MIECKDGSYSTGGKSNCTECPAGFACPSKTDDLQILCYPGSYTLNKARVSIIILIYEPLERTIAVFVHHNFSTNTLKTTPNQIKAMSDTGMGPF